MTQLRFVPAAFAASAVFLFSSLSSAIVAPLPGCGSGPACGVGYECTVVGGSSCASTPPCAAGESCPAPEPCVTTDEYGCTPAHCSADAECAPGMVCHAWMEPCAVTDCACAPDVPNCGCGTTSCDPVSVSMCTPRYLLPCATAADCGDGFTCEEQMSGCATAGTGPAPAPGAAPLPPDGAAGSASDPIEPIPVPACTPQPTGQFQCVAKNINCQTAGDCPAGWSCEQPVIASAPACAPDANCPAADPVPLPAPVCRPPYYGATSGVDLSGPATPTAQGPGSNNGSTTGVGGGTAGSGTPAPEKANANANDGSSHESAACQMGHAPASSGVLSLLTLLGALFGLKRRRAHG